MARRAELEDGPPPRSTVDLGARTAVCGDVECAIGVDDYTRWRLMEGLDDIGLTLRHGAEVEAFEASRPSWLPTTLPAR